MQLPEYAFSILINTFQAPHSAPIDEKPGYFGVNSKSKCRVNANHLALEDTVQKLV